MQCLICKFNIKKDQYGFLINSTKFEIEPTYGSSLDMNFYTAYICDKCILELKKEGLLEEPYNG